MLAPNKSTYRSGELAHIAGISPDTLRYYERTGVLPLPQRNLFRIPHLSRSSAPTREPHPQRSLHRFSIKELARILKQRDTGHPPCAKSTNSQRQIDSSRDPTPRHPVLRRNLQSLIRTWDSKLSHTPRANPRKLLESLQPSRPAHKATYQSPKGRNRLARHGSGGSRDTENRVP